MLHEVKPHIVSFNKDDEMLIDRVTNGTLHNTGNVPFEYGFGDGGWRQVNEGQEVSLPAGANTIFETGTRLLIRFIEPSVASSDDYKRATFIYNEIKAVGKSV